MKKITTVIFAAIFSLIMVNTASAQFEGGAALVFGSGAFDNSDLDNDLGLRVEGRYAIDEKFGAGADITFFFPKEQGPVTARLLNLNLNGFYDFYSKDMLNLYALAGVNVAFVKVEAGGNEATDEEIGLNLGAGAEYALDFGNLFGELKFAGVGGDADQFVLAAGIRIPFGGN